MSLSIAVIIPVYNVENFLVQCLESIVMQTKSFDEVILVNDGSTDGSLSICKEYVSRYKYFKLLSQENQGLSVARNLGIEYTSSEYIMFLDSDDFLHLDTVKILKHKLLNSSYDAVFFDAEIICEKGMEFVRKNDYDRSKANLDGKLFCGYEYFAECYPNNYVVSSCMAIYKRKRIVSANIKFPEGIYFEDNYFTLMFICQAKCVIHISEKLYQRRYRENSITTSKYSERKFMDYIKCFLLIVDKIYQMDYLKLREKFLEFISDWLNNGFSNYLMCKEQDIILSENAIYLIVCRKHMYTY